MFLRGGNYAILLGTSFSHARKHGAAQRKEAAGNRVARFRTAHETMSGQGWPTDLSCS